MHFERMRVLEKVNKEYMVVESSVVDGGDVIIIEMAMDIEKDVGIQSENIRG